MNHTVRSLPTQLLHHLVAQGFTSLGVIGSEIDIDKSPVIFLGHLGTQAVDIIIAAINSYQHRVIDSSSNQLARFYITRNEDVSQYFCLGGVGGDTGSQVAG